MTTIVDLETDGGVALFALLMAADGPVPRLAAMLAHRCMIPARTDAETRAAWGRPLGHARSRGAIVEDFGAGTYTLNRDHELTRSMVAALAECPDTIARARRALAKGRDEAARLDARRASR